MHLELFKLTLVLILHYPIDPGVPMMISLLYIFTCH